MYPASTLQNQPQQNLTVPPRRGQAGNRAEGRGLVEPRSSKQNTRGLCPSLTLPRWGGFGQVIPLWAAGFPCPMSGLGGSRCSALEALTRTLKSNPVAGSPNCQCRINWKAEWSLRLSEALSHVDWGPLVFIGCFCLASVPGNP